MNHHSVLSAYHDLQPGVYQIRHTLAPHGVLDHCVTRILLRSKVMRTSSHSGMEHTTTINNTGSLLLHLCTMHTPPGSVWCACRRPHYQWLSGSASRGQQPNGTPTGHTEAYPQRTVATARGGGEEGRGVGEYLLASSLFLTTLLVHMLGGLLNLG